MPDEKRQTRLVVQIVFAILLVIAAGVFLELANRVWLHQTFAWDAAVISTVQAWSSPVLDVVFRAISLTAGGWAFIPVVLVAVWLWRRDRRFSARLVVLSSVVMSVLNVALKLLFARSRPNPVPALVFHENYSFPSGHTTEAVAFYGLLAVILWRQQRYGLSILSLLWVPLVGLSRVYLGAHFPSDVLASMALGTVWLISLFTIVDIYLPGYI